MLRNSDYFDGSTYNWNSSQMNRLYKILDYCQSHGVTVMLGEWWKPSWAGTFNNSTYINSIADCLNYLRNTKGYTSIKYYNFMNEPNGDWMYGSGAPDLTTKWNNWSSGVTTLYNTLNSRGYTSWIQIVGPDSAYQDDWVDKTLNGLGTQIGQFEFHIYKDYDSQVVNGDIESTVSSKRSLLNGSSQSSKMLWLGELGMKEGRSSTYDSQPRVANFDYGVLIADGLAQTIRGGGAGAVPWDMDDAMHLASSDGTLKMWGMWNSLGGSTIGSKYYPPSDTNLRPWFYPYSLFTKLFGQGWQTLSVSQPSMTGLRVAAAKKANGSNWDVSIAVVNDSDTSRSILIKAPGVTNTATFKEYHYFNSDRPVDGNGFPVPYQDRVNNLSSGVEVSLPGKGVIFLTTTQGGTTVSTGTSESQAPIGKTIWLKSVTNNSYVSAWIDGTNPLQARATEVKTWEKFDVVDAGNGAIALRAEANNKYVSAWINETNSPLRATADIVDAWEKFQWVDAGGGNIALKSVANGKYISAWVNETYSPLKASASQLLDWEMFQWGQ